MFSFLITGLKDLKRREEFIYKISPVTCPQQWIKLRLWQKIKIYLQEQHFQRITVHLLSLNTFTHISVCVFFLLFRPGTRVEFWKNNSWNFFVQQKCWMESHKRKIEEGKRKANCLIKSLSYASREYIRVLSEKLFFFSASSCYSAITKSSSSFRNPGAF